MPPFRIIVVLAKGVIRLSHYHLLDYYLGWHRWFPLRLLWHASVTTTTNSPLVVLVRVFFSACLSC